MMKISNGIIRLPALAALSVMLGYGDGLTGTIPTTNVVEQTSTNCGMSCVDASTLEDDIRKFAEIMSNTNLGTRGLWVLGTNILDRIVAEVDEAKYMEHFQKVEDAILDVKFKEWPLSNASEPYGEWERSISLFKRLSFMYSVSRWKKIKDIDHGREFDLKQLAVYRREIERIADAKERQFPRGHSGMHGSLECVRSSLMSDRELVMKSAFSHGSFADYYIGLPETERERWRKRIEHASGLKFELGERWKIRAHDEEVRKPHDGGDVLSHPFTFLGCTFGNAYEVSRRGGKDTLGDVILCWYSNFAIEPYFGKKWMMLSLAPRSKIAFSAKISWSEFDGLKTREDMRVRAEEIKTDVEKRLGVKLGAFFFESGQHVCDEGTWNKANFAQMKSRSVFGPVRIEIEAIYDGQVAKSHRVVLTITDTEAEALVEKERKENPLTYDSKAEREAERLKFEKLKEMSRRRKLIPAKKPEK